MAFSLIIKNSIRQYKSVYFLVYAVLFLCIFSLSFFSAFTDSAANGEALQATAVTHGSNMIVYPAKEGDLHLFSSLDIEEMWYEDNIIYIRCKTLSDQDKIAWQIANIIGKENTGLRVNVFDSSFTVGYLDGGFVSVIKFFLFALSFATIYYVFTALVNRQKEDFAAYRMLGMNQMTFFTVLGLEYLIVFPVALATAIPSAAALMKVVISLYFQDVIKNNAIGALVYSFKARNILLIIALTILSAAFSYFFLLYRIIKNDVVPQKKSVSFLYTDFIFKRKSPCTTLSVINFNRKRSLNAIAFLLVVPVGFLALLEINQLFEPEDKDTTFDFVITDPGIDDVSGLSFESIEEIKGFPYVSSCRFEYYNNNFAEKSILSHDNPFEGRVAFNVLYGSDAQELTACAENPSMVYANAAFRGRYSVGDTVNLIHTPTGKMFEACIAGFYETADSPVYLTLYCTIENFRNLTNIETAPRTVWVDVEDTVSDKDLASFREWLGSRFQSYGDYIQNAENSRILSERMKITSAIRSGTTVIAALLTLGAVLMIEVDSRKDEFFIMQKIGSTNRQIRSTLFVEMFLRFFLCTTFTILPDMAITLWKGAVNSAGFSFLDIVIDVCMVLILLTAFILPPEVTLSRLLLEKDNRKEFITDDIGSICVE